MKVLVLFEYANHYQTIDNLCNHLNKKGIEASSFNITYWRYRKGIKEQPALWFRLLCLIARIPGFRGLISSRFRDRALLKLSESHDIINIHFFSPAYDRLIVNLGRKGKSVMVSIWGSDFFKADKLRREEQGKLYKHVRIIQLETREISREFLEVYPELEDRVRIAHFGIVQLDLIDQLLQKGSAATYKKELAIPGGRMLVSCGTNRSMGHQHLKMLESFERLAPGLQEQVYLIIPMTYGGELSYMETVRQKAESLGIPYRILDSFLSLDELCKYRIVSDMLLTIQESDALSSAIQEHLYTGEHLIAGDWLPYQVLKDHQVFFTGTSMESLDEVLTDAIEMHSTFREKCSGNRERISAFSAWDQVIEDWLGIYREIGT